MRGHVIGRDWRDRVALWHNAPVTALTFARTPKALSNGARHLVVIAPTRRLAKNRIPASIGPAKLRRQISELARENEAGERGASGTTLTGGKPARLTVLVLPDDVSRYNAPSRAETITRLLGAVDLGSKGKVAVLLILDDAEHLLPAANAVGRAIPLYTAKSGSHPPRVQLLAVDPKGEVVKPDTVVEATVIATRESAQLVDTPPTELDPAEFSRRAQQILGELEGVVVKEITGDALVKHGLMGIHSVGRAAVSEPRMLVASYKPKARGALRVALVGKGVTYDTGGLHIKARGFMEGMKCDMGGAAAVFGAFRVLVEEGCPHELHLLLCLAENAIGPASYKPDDVLTLHSGKTVEINNTDAEGRLLLADGVSWAARELKADVVFDAATLTGAQLIATGLCHAAVVSNDGDLEQLMVHAGRDCGDLCHPLVFAPELLRPEFKSVVADMRNSVANRLNAQSSCAAQFVYAHLEGAPGAATRRWCHIDLAGPAFPRDRGTGYGVALISTAIRRLEA